MRSENRVFSNSCLFKNGLCVYMHKMRPLPPLNSLLFEKIARSAEVSLNRKVWRACANGMRHACNGDCSQSPDRGRRSAVYRSPLSSRIPFGARARRLAGWAGDVRARPLAIVWYATWPEQWTECECAVRASSCSEFGWISPAERCPANGMARYPCPKAGISAGTTTARSISSTT